MDCCHREGFRIEVMEAGDFQAKVIIETDPWHILFLTLSRWFLYGHVGIYSEGKQGGGQ